MSATAGRRRQATRLRQSLVSARSRSGPAGDQILAPRETQVSVPGVPGAGRRDREGSPSQQPTISEHAVRARGPRLLLLCLARLRPGYVRAWIGAVIGRFVGLG
jgi:hypothetical protein